MFHHIQHKVIRSAVYKSCPDTEVVLSTGYKFFRIPLFTSSFCFQKNPKNPNQINVPLTIQNALSM